MLSIDRYDTVKRPRVLHLRKKQLIPILVALFALCSAGLVTAPFLFLHQPDQSRSNHHQHQQQQHQHNQHNQQQYPSHNHTTVTTSIQTTSSNHQQNLELIRNRIRATSSSATMPATTNHQMCVSPSTAADPLSGWYTSFIVVHTVCVFVVPGLGILVNHVRVRKKLCALSLTARAAHGELPLPMPLLRRQNVIIVTGIANTNLTRATPPATFHRDRNRETRAAGKRASNRARTASPSAQAAAAPQVKRKPQSKRLGPLLDKNRTADRADRSPDIRAPISSTTSNNVQAAMGNPEFPLPQTSTLIFRRRLANILMTAALLFLLCWSPYVVSIFYCAVNGMCSRTISDLALLLGNYDCFL